MTVLGLPYLRRLRNASSRTYAIEPSRPASGAMQVLSPTMVCTPSYVCFPFTTPLATILAPTFNVKTMPSVIFFL